MDKSHFTDGLLSGLADVPGLRLCEPKVDYTVYANCIDEDEYHPEVDENDYEMDDWKVDQDSYGMKKAMNK